MFVFVVATVALAFVITIILKIGSLYSKRIVESKIPDVSIPCMVYNAQSVSTKMERVSKEHSNSNSPVRDTEEFIDCTLKYVDANKDNIENRIIEICCRGSI